MRKLLLLVINCILFTIATNAQIPQYYVGGLGAGSSNSWPFNSGTGGSNQVQLLYFSSHVNPINCFNAPPPSGFITKIYLKPTSTGSFVYPNVVIKMGNTTLTTLTTGPWVGGLTTVYSATSTTLVAAANQWMGITLQTPFYYDNTKQLLVEVSQGQASGISLNFTNGTPNTRSYGQSASASGTADQEVYHFGIDIFAGYPCTTIPVSLVDAPSKVCPNDTFRVAPKTFYANASYQWQYSLDGNNWSNVTNTLGLYGDFKDYITEPKWYRCKITCLATPSLTYTTPAWKVNINPFYYCYCKNKSSVTSGLDIGNYTVSKASNGIQLLNNGNPIPALSNQSANRDYTDYMDTISPNLSYAPVVLYRDSSYVFKVTQINSGASVVSGTASV